MSNLERRGGEVLQQDDLRLIYKHYPQQVQHELLRRWPTLLHWKQVRDGEQVNMESHNVMAAVMFLRRMYAFWGGRDLSGGKPTLLTQLAWKNDPLSENTKPEEMQALFGELGLSTTGDENPTFQQILHHDTMASVWGTPSMTLCCSEGLQQEEGKEPSLIELSPTQPLWKFELVKFDGSVPIAKKMTERVNCNIMPTVRLLCNFPPFIRVHYQAAKESAKTTQRFSDLRYFEFPGMTIANETDTVQQEHGYVLIACFLEPDKTADIGEIRLYSNDGRPVLPQYAESGVKHLYDPASQRRIGDPGLECVLLYGKTTEHEQHPGCSELPSLLEKRTTAVLGTAKRLVDELLAGPTPPRVPQRQASEAPSVLSLPMRPMSRQQSPAMTALPATVLQLRRSSQGERQAGEVPRVSAPAEAVESKRAYGGDDDGPPVKREPCEHSEDLGNRGYSDSTRPSSPLDSRQHAGTTQQTSSEHRDESSQTSQQPRGRDTRVTIGYPPRLDSRQHMQPRQQPSREHSNNEFNQTSQHPRSGHGRGGRGGRGGRTPLASQEDVFKAFRRGCN